MFLPHHDLQTCLLIEMQMSESHRHVTALGRSVSRHFERRHVTRIRTSVTHRQKPVRACFFYFHSASDALCLFFLVSLLSPPPPSTVAHTHPHPPSLPACTLSLRPIHIPQVTGYAESGFVPPLLSSHLICCSSAVEC